MLVRDFRRRAMPAVFIVAGIGAGFLGGTFTVNRMTPGRYGAEAVAASYDASQLPPSEDCNGCSERDLGYRWAGMRRIVSANDCPTDSWGFHRGCTAYVHDRNGG